MASEHLPSSSHPYTSSINVEDGTTEDCPTDCVPHKDIRSLRRSRNRHAKQSAKYYGFRGVDPNWIGQQYDPVWRYEQIYWWKPFKALPLEYRPYQDMANPVDYRQNSKSHTYTKRDMWLDRDINIWPLGRRHHVGKRYREKWSWSYQEQSLQRRGKQRARALAFEAEDPYWIEDVDLDFDDDIYELQDGYECPVAIHEDDEIPDSSTADIFHVLHDQVWDEDDDYSIIDDRDFDVLSIVSDESCWKFS